MQKALTIMNGALCKGKEALTWEYYNSFMLCSYNCQMILDQTLVKVSNSYGELKHDQSFEVQMVL